MPSRTMLKIALVHVLLCIGCVLLLSSCASTTPVRVKNDTIYISKAKYRNYTVSKTDTDFVIRLNQVRNAD